MNLTNASYCIEYINLIYKHSKQNDLDFIKQSTIKKKLNSRLNVGDLNCKTKEERNSRWYKV